MNSAEEPIADKPQAIEEPVPVQEEPQAPICPSAPRMSPNGGIYYPKDVCSICFNGEVITGNEILYCDNCDIAVHQLCYSVSKV